LRSRGDTCQRRRTKPTVPRGHLSALDMRAQTAIVALKHRFPPEPLRAHVTLGAAAPLKEAAREEKVERAPAVRGCLLLLLLMRATATSTARGRREPLCDRTRFDQCKAVHEQDRTTLGRSRDRGFFGGGKIGRDRDGRMTGKRFGTRLEVEDEIGFRGERSIWGRRLCDGGCADS